MVNAVLEAIHNWIIAIDKNGEPISQDDGGHFSC
jgi:hypothetical protein